MLVRLPQDELAFQLGNTWNIAEVDWVPVGTSLNSRTPPLEGSAGLHQLSTVGYGVARPLYLIKDFDVIIRGRIILSEDWTDSNPHRSRSRYVSVSVHDGGVVSPEGRKRVMDGSSR